MKKLFVAIILAVILLLHAAALAVDYTIPDPEYFFGTSMEETSKNNYVMHFDDDPRDMYDAYMALLLSDYNMDDLEVTRNVYIFSKVGVEKSGMTIQYSADDEGYSITFAIPTLLQPEKREQYDPNRADAREESGIVLPDPGHYFDKFYTAGTISFDEYPKAEFDAYTALLTGQYGLEITEEYHSENKEYYHMTVPGVDNARVYVSCFYDSDRHYWTGSGNAMDITFSGSIALAALDVYGQHGNSEIAWDNGRMIADPGDFLGYEINVTEIQDKTDWDYGGNYFQREYEETDTHDIRQYIDALESSPYFEICDTYEAKHASYKQIFFEYVGSDPELSAICEEGRRNPKRTCDLYIQIHHRGKEQSTFRIVTFPAFTVNSTANVTPAPDPNPDSKERCLFCNKGSCKECGGTGYVYQYAAFEKDWRERKDCSSCIAGRCTHCDGSGWR